MSLKHLKAGSEMPPLTQSTLRLYSMVFCPYAQRTRLILEAKNIPYETVNINLTSKPEWYLKLNPAGQVPCLHFPDGRILPESLVNSEYLDLAYPETRLMPTDPFENALQKLFIERYSKLITSYYKALKTNDAEALAEFKTNLSVLETKLPAKGFLGGDKPAFADYMIWPWLERLEALELVKKVKFEQEEYPNVLGYINRMKEVPAVKKILIKPETHVEFYMSYLTGKEPNYDLLY